MKIDNCKIAHWPGHSEISISCVGDRPKTSCDTVKIEVKNCLEALPEKLHLEELLSRHIEAINELRDQERTVTALENELKMDLRTSSNNAADIELRLNKEKTKCITTKARIKILQENCAEADQASKVAAREWFYVFRDLKAVEVASEVGDARRALLDSGLVENLLKSLSQEETTCAFLRSVYTYLH